MKEDKIYKVVDGSWSTKVNNDGIAEQSWEIYLQPRRFKIVAEGLVLPTYKTLGIDPSRMNNTIIQDIEDKTIVFIRREFLREVSICPHCGKEINN